MNEVKVSFCSFFFMRLVDYGRMFIVPSVIMVKYFLI